MMRSFHFSEPKFRVKVNNEFGRALGGFQSKSGAFGEADDRCLP
jgi:hypothetical protein